MNASVWLSAKLDILLVDTLRKALTKAMWLCMGNSSILYGIEIENLIFFLYFYLTHGKHRQTVGMSSTRTIFANHSTNNVQWKIFFFYMAKYLLQTLKNVSVVNGRPNTLDIEVHCFLCYYDSSSILGWMDHDKVSSQEFLAGEKG